MSNLRSSLAISTLLTTLVGCASGGGSAAGGSAVMNTPSNIRNSNDLEITDTRVGAGARATVGQCMYVHYVGVLADGRQFDSTQDTLPNGRPQPPLVFELGTGAVMQGWERGLTGMQVGGRRRLWVPYRMAYGAAGQPPVIPPRTDLIFDLELVGLAAALPTSSNAVRAETAKTCPTWTFVNRAR